MLKSRPIPPISSFNQLFSSVAKTKYYNEVIDMHKMMSNAGVVPDFVTFNILVNRFCCINRIDFGFSVLGVILKKGYIPSIITYTSLVKGLCVADKIVEALILFDDMVELGCEPDIVTYDILLKGLCRTGNTELALKLHHELAYGNRSTSTTKIKPNVVCYNTIIDSLFKIGQVG